MQYFVLGNWKSNGDASMVREYGASFTRPDSADTVGCGLALPFHLLHLGETLGELWCGAQNVSAHGEGAFTGEITASMLAASGCRFCLVGHSERRQLFGESVADTAAKLNRLFKNGVYPVFCIGETLEEREEGRLEQVLREQLSLFADVPADARFAVAYEPVWAIGTGVAASSQEVGHAHGLVKSLLGKFGFQNTPVLYGGSVKPENAAELGAIDGVDGFLVGGASLKPRDLSGILSGFCTGKAL